MQLIVNKHTGATRRAGITYGRSPAMSALSDMRKISNISLYLMSAEAMRYQMCVSFWECRKVRGLFAIFFLGHNLHCGFKADFYRAKIQVKIDSIVNRKD